MVSVSSPPPFSPFFIPSATIRSVDAEQEFTASSVVKTCAPGLKEYDIRIQFAQRQAPSPIVLEWLIPLVDIAGKWHPTIGSDRSLSSGWVQTINNYATLGAPVYALYSGSGENRHTFALSDAINPVGIRVQVEEDVAAFKCTLVLFDAPWPEMDKYSFILRIDERAIAYNEALAGVSDWWAGMDEYRPAPVPEAAYDPVYSSWYSFHQELSEEGIEANCAWSRDLGCRTLILDDGWQTDDSNKGYAYCGDWEIAESKFPDFTAHVARIKALDMRYLLWYSVPYVGNKSEAWQCFRDRVLPKPHRNADCLDPRFPSVRGMLIDCYRRAIGEWGLDGLKLDFVDQFTAEVAVKSDSEEADMVSVPAATDRLFTDIMAELRTLNPDVLIEFRQRYIGPAMRKYGNIFRAQDCPNDALSNRVRTIDLRLLSGNTAVHSDMVMWNAGESVERAALQLWAILFSVPQISVEKDAIGEAHQRMLAFYLRFWLERKDLLMHGKLTPLNPLCLYPVVIAENDTELCAVVYQEDCIMTLPPLKERSATLVNATEMGVIHAAFGNSTKNAKITVYDCCGILLSTRVMDGISGIVTIVTPCSGYAKVTITS
ncbi:glycoside hydrolase family 36 protein [Cerasicoccus arenae]|uniref:Alpha-galactosidase n=1 Tax=Cerasicoccus arenae TaxID=424488 RepID=A0A8J3DAA1_9BACT|nr:glycoside hydrolase family 36 protein [Cerasicoccus arenae]MBK1859872.1 alpha-galactosidase [Cerasicoccus arenae]GHC01372.1 hypothetical protein GCM10007047_17290 [Cerasicoccus arenae]